MMNAFEKLKCSLSQFFYFFPGNVFQEDVICFNHTGKLIILTPGFGVMPVNHMLQGGF